MIVTKKIAYPAFALMMGVFVGLLLAEGVAAFFLPAPQAHKLPMVRMLADIDCGYIHRPNQNAYSNGGEVTINQWGFRGENWSVTKKTGTKRIALLGDSYTFGQGVDDDQTFGAMLQSKLDGRSSERNQYEVMNFGASGYDLGHELAVLKKHALRFSPDVVIVHFFLNDLYAISDYEFYPDMFKKEAERFSVIKWFLRELARKSRIVMTAWDYRQSKNPSGAINMMDPYISGGVQAPEGVGREQWETIAGQLHEFRELADKHNFVPIFVIIPTPQEMINQEIAGTYENYLLQEAEKNSLMTLSLLPTIRAAGDPKELIIPYDAHFNAKGNEVVASALLTKLKTVMDTL